MNLSVICLFPLEKKECLIISHRMVQIKKENPASCIQGILEAGEGIDHNR
jgi:hypothetical protein